MIACRSKVIGFPMNIFLVTKFLTTRAFVDTSKRLFFRNCSATSLENSILICMFPINTLDNGPSLRVYSVINLDSERISFLRTAIRSLIAAGFGTNSIFVVHLTSLTLNVNHFSLKSKIRSK